jgi:hypothetical protein
MQAVLSPTTRTLGAVFLDQLRGAVMGAPQTVGLIAGTIVLFVAGYVLGKRSGPESRAVTAPGGHEGPSLVRSSPRRP